MAKLFLRCFEIDITDDCNLKCAGCSHFSPLTKNPWYISLDQYSSDIKRMSELFVVNEIRILGGEPFLHPQLTDIVKVTRKYFPNCKLKIDTNGILTDKINSLKEYSKLSKLNVQVQISDYPAVKSQLDLSKIDKTQFDHLNLNLNGCSNPEISRTKCKNITAYTLLKGRFYMCPVMANIDKFINYFNLDMSIDEKSRSIDIYKNSNLEIYNFINNMDLGCKVCRYCNSKHKKIDWKPSEKQITEWIE